MPKMLVEEFMTSLNGNTSERGIWSKSDKGDVSDFQGLDIDVKTGITENSKISSRRTTGGCVTERKICTHL
jgi:ribosomal protein S18